MLNKMQSAACRDFAGRSRWATTAWIVHVQRGRVCGSKVDRLRSLGASVDFAAEAHVAKAAFERAGLRLVGDVLTVTWTVTSAESVRGSGRSVVTRGPRRAPGRSRRARPSARCRCRGRGWRESSPSRWCRGRWGRRCAVMPPFLPTPLAMVCSCGTPGCGCGETCTASTALSPGLTQLGDVEDAADERALDGAGLGAVDPDLRREIYAVEVEPDVAVRRSPSES